MSPVRARASERGAAAAEFALTLPAVVLVLVVAFAGVMTAVDQVRCVDAARLAARALARGDPPSVAVGLAARAAPEGARVATSRSGDLIHVRVTSRRTVPGSGIGWSVDSASTAALEVTGQ